jgi:hypothetical protein
MRQIFRVAWQEIALFLCCVFAILGTVISRGGVGEPATLLWVIMLAVQALPYGATIVTASFSAAANVPAPLATPEPAPAPEPVPLPEQKQAA